MLGVLDGSVHAASASRQAAATRSTAPNLAIRLGRTVSARSSTVTTHRGIGPDSNGDSNSSSQGKRQRSTARKDARTIRGNLGYVRPEKRKVGELVPRARLDRLTRRSAARYSSK